MRAWASHLADNALVVALLAAMAIFLLAPLGVLAGQSLTTDAGALTLKHFVAYFTTPGLQRSLVNTFILATLVVALVLPLAFIVAYTLERTEVRFKGFLAAASSAPLLIPSLLPALALVYLFGRQGLLTPLFGGRTIYGAQGVLLSDVIATFPHALLLLRTAIRASDGRLYEQAELMGASAWRTFWSITIPGVRHGAVSAAVVVFSLVIADVGAPKVVGGDFNVLALDIYKNVMGQQNFRLGSVAALMLLAPSIVAVLLERMASRRQASLISSRSTIHHPKLNPLRDWTLGLVSSVIAFAVVGVILVCQLAALVRQWPYDLTPGLASYDLNRFDGGGWMAIVDSALLGLGTATLGVIVAFVSAYATARTKAVAGVQNLLAAVALLPAAVPGLALGLAYVLLFNDPANPLHGLYSTVTILVVVTVVHFYATAHLTMMSAMKALDAEFEAAGEVLGRSRWSVMLQVISPLCAPAMVDLFGYLFISATTTVSAVVFLYPPDFKLASVAVLNMDDAGDIAPAAAMGMLLVYLNLAVLGLVGATRRWIVKPRDVAHPPTRDLTTGAGLAAGADEPRLTTPGGGEHD